MPPAAIKLQALFERYREHPWILLRPLGNWGDELIFAGAETMASRLGLEWQSAGTADFPSIPITPEHCIYLHGGGGYNSWCSGRAFTNLELAVARHACLVVQGPVSTESDQAWLADRFKSALQAVNTRDFVFFAREDVTLRLLQELRLEAHGATLGIDHDTALALTAADLLRIAGLDVMPRGNYDLVVLREDDEQPADLAASGTPAPGVALDPARAAGSFEQWVRIHLYARSITTNRLHSSIIGAIAGKPVSIGPGSYHKNESVWRYSLEGRGVRWVERISPPRALLWHLLPAVVRKSYKVNQLRLALHRIPLR